MHTIANITILSSCILVYSQILFYGIVYLYNITHYVMNIFYICSYVFNYLPKNNFKSCIC